jgi:hypothetical protein
MRMALLTYHKFSKDDWRPDEFSSQNVTLTGGENVTMKLAERGSRLSNMARLLTLLLLYQAVYIAFPLRGLPNPASRPCSCI